MITQILTPLISHSLLITSLGEEKLPCPKEVSPSVPPPGLPRLGNYYFVSFDIPIGQKPYSQLAKPVSRIMMKFVIPFNVSQWDHYQTGLMKIKHFYCAEYALFQHLPTLVLVGSLSNKNFCNVILYLMRRRGSCTTFRGTGSARALLLSGRCLGRTCFTISPFCSQNCS